MRKTVTTSFGVFVAALAGIVIWYAVYTHQIQSKLNAFMANAQQQRLVKVNFTVNAPPETPKDQTLFLSGSRLQRWAAVWDAAGLPAGKQETMEKYHGSAEVMSGVSYGFKVTRGTWGTVETGDKGEETPDHPLKVSDPDSVDVSVASWRDGGKSVPNRVTMTGDIRLHLKFHSKNLGNDRTLIVYLPPDYDKSSTRYPVLYMQDGQNLFDAATSYAGVEWRVDETAQQLIASKAIPPMIIVGIYNGGKERTAEFTPPGMAGDPSAGRADLYGKFVAEEVKPFIDKTYRTQADKAHTGIAGGSMGGLVSLHIVKEYPQVFGQMALFSPWLRIGDKKLIENDLGDGSWAKGMRIDIDMGSEGGANYPGKDPIGDAKELDKFLKSAGVSAADYQYTEVPGLEHNEPAWQTRRQPVLTWMYVRAGRRRWSTGGSSQFAIR